MQTQKTPRIQRPFDLQTQPRSSERLVRFCELVRIKGRDAERGIGGKSKDVCHQKTIEALAASNFSARLRHRPMTALSSVCFVLLRNGVRVHRALDAKTVLKNVYRDWNGAECVTKGQFFSTE